MIENNQFEEHLCREIEELSELQKKLQIQLSNPPEGTLHIQRNGKRKYTQYYMCGEDRKRIYIPKERRDMAYALAQKAYDKQVLSIIQARLKCAEQLLRQYRQTVNGVYSKLSDARRSLVTPIVSTDEAFLMEWYKKHPGSANPYPSGSVLYSERGEAVRSKSEKILADLFFRRGIPYVYEPQIILNSGKAVYPDFLLLNIERRKTYVYEHFGMMDNPEYAKNAVEKLSLYSGNGYWYGDTLLFSVETSISPLDTRNVEKMICYFLKKAEPIL